MSTEIIPVFSEAALAVFANHYYQENESCPEDVFRRVREFYKAAGLNDRVTNFIFDAQRKKQFSFNSPVYYNAHPDQVGKGQLLACFVAGDIPDSMDGIMWYAKRAALIFKTGAGMGFNVGSLRPEGASIGDGGLQRVGPQGSSGPLSYMRIFHEVGDTVMSAGKRRAAMWAGMYVNHPDVMRFICCKRGESRLKYTNMNISLVVTDDFMRAVIDDEQIDLEWKGVLWEKVQARDILHEAAISVHAGGDPGLMFLDTVNFANTTPSYGKITCVNPCVAGDTLINTVGGLVPAKDLVGVPFKAVVDGKEYESAGFWSTGFKETYVVQTEEGYEVRATADHLIKTYTNPRGYVWKKVCELKPGDRVVLSNSRKIRRELVAARSTPPANPTQMWLYLEENTDRVRSIDRFGTEEVFDCSVEEIHCFDANGIIVHNCGEIPLPANTSCNLGSIVLNNVAAEIGVPDDKTEKNVRDWLFTQFLPKIGEIARYAMAHLDANIDINAYPDEEFERNTKEIRPTGLGISGLGELFFMLRVPYGSRFAQEIGAAIMAEITSSAFTWSTSAFTENGVLPPCEASKNQENAQALADQMLRHAIWCATHLHRFGGETPQERRFRELANTVRKEGSYRNSYVTCIAPTGNTGIAFDAITTGCEPAFALVYPRNTRNGVLNIVDFEFENALRERGIELTDERKEEILDNAGSCQGLDWVPEDLQEIFVVAGDIHYEDRIQQQAALQAFTSQAISSTINLPHDTTPDVIEDIYIKAWEAGLKGITCYRDGSIQFAPVTLTKDNSDALPDTMPEISNAETQKFTAENVAEEIASGIGEQQNLDANSTANGNVVLRETFKRPAVTVGKTFEVRMTEGAHTEKFYITINEDPENPGRPIEVFLAGGKSGHNEPAMAQGLCRVISGWLQDGAPVKSIIRKLVDIRGHARGILYLPDMERPVQVWSLCDALARVLEDLYVTPVETDENGNKTRRIPGLTRCPRCSMNTLRKEGGCEVCIDCGYSKC